MTLRLTNTLSRHKETFAPADPNHVTMYVCGPTATTSPISVMPDRLLSSMCSIAR